MKQVLYVIYAVLFYMYSLTPINKKKTTFIMTHDASINGNIMKMYQKVKEERPDEVCKFVTKKRLQQAKGFKRLVEEAKFVISSAFHLATSKTIFLDNVFLPMAFMHFKKEVKVVQLWHGCNTLKKFGQLSNTGRLKVLEKRANSCYTHLMTSSTKMNKLHQETFGVSEDKIYALGLPRMDSFFEGPDKLQKEKELFYQAYPQLRGKTLILYAPTFRDNDLEITDKNMDLSQVIKKLPTDYVLLMRLHPFISQRYKGANEERVIDVSQYNDLNRLLMVSDILITDYSSVIFEYALLDKPIIFYAYDQAAYGNQIRGFYYPYEEYVPGIIVRDKSQLIECLEKKAYLQYNYEGFVEGYLDYRDNASAERIYQEIYGNEA